MSVELFVHLQRSKMLTPRRWADAIRSAVFSVDLDDGFDVDADSGFRPCRFDGVSSGFEYAGRPLTNEERAALELPASFDFSVTLTTHSDMRELAASTVAAAVLCRLA